MTGITFLTTAQLTHAQVYRVYVICRLDTVMRDVREHYECTQLIRRRASMSCLGLQASGAMVLPCLSCLRVSTRSHDLAYHRVSFSRMQKRSLARTFADQIQLQRTPAVPTFTQCSVRCNAAYSSPWSCEPRYPCRLHSWLNTNILYMI